RPADQTLSIIRLADATCAIRENVHRTFYEETNFLFTNFLPDTSDFLLEGDIVLPKTRNALKCLNRKFSCLWPKRNGRVEVPYTLDDKYDQTEKADILRAMKGFEWKTCIRFIPRSRQTGYLSIVPRFGCSSLVGYLGDKQMVSLQKFGCITQGIIQHELLHALGFYHEHTRSDRDYYVTINWQNVQKNFEFNFQKQDTNNQDAPYDYSSVMHYGRTAFGARGAETITPYPDSSVSIGQRECLSDIDIYKINRLYNFCPKRCIANALQIE
uniref:Metalloendopeptidase n=1 Tax=Gouania willdenowi TaxID=441366 RepID=A0A8C5GSV7_GOUWI